jgi:multiple antibiotic resistance protein
MAMPETLRIAVLLMMLLNPFLLVVYLFDAFAKIPARAFAASMVRAGIISAGVFITFALLGEVIFRDILQAQFASFQIFGGILFLIIGIRFVFEGNVAIEALRGESKDISGAVAMPLMIGPGTIGASVLAGERLGPSTASLTIVAVVALCVLVVIGLKRFHDFVRPRNEELVQRYIEVAGRVMALVVGTFAVEMIMTGLDTWLKRLG